MRLVCHPYNHKLPIINQLKRIIKERYQSIFVAVFVHGSIATDEIIPYSDFDGLLIINDEYLNSKTFARFQRESNMLINRFDPFQHHGWFIIAKSQLIHYPQTYFPYELFEYSRLIFPDYSLMINICFNVSYDFYKPFKRLTSSIKAKIQRRNKIQSMYSLKCLLSEIMLLPTLYYQAKTKNGIYKKFSFTVVKQEISPEAWKVIEICTRIRESWTTKYNSSSLVFMLLNDYVLTQAFARKVLAPPIPKTLSIQLDDTFYRGCLELITEMDQKLYEL